MHLMPPCAELLRAPHALVRTLVQHPPDVAPRPVRLGPHVDPADLDLLVSQDNRSLLGYSFLIVAEFARLLCRGVKLVDLDTVRQAVLWRSRAIVR